MMCLLIMTMLQEAHWHNEGRISNYAVVCFHMFVAIRYRSGQIVTDFRQNP